MTLQESRTHPSTSSNRRAATTPGAVVERARGSRWIPWAALVAVAAAYGAVASQWTPRGPLSAFEAITALALGLLVGTAAGLVAGSRWAMLVTPVAFAASFELGRLDVAGPTVDSIHLDSTYAIMALVLGRGVHGLLALLPMVLGAALGAGLARHWWPAGVQHVERRAGARHALSVGLRRVAAGLTALALLAVVVVVARPATTDAIVGADGRTLPGSVAELTTVETGSHDLAVMVRGTSVRNPVLLFLAGGPGGSELGAMRRHSQALEEHFVVVTLDQRGTGKSYGQLDPSSTLTLDAAVDDVITTTRYLRDRFHQERIYLLGQSWGTLLGVLAVRREPQLFEAFIGAGQMVAPAETDRVFYRDTLAWARETGDRGLVEQLTGIGPPPYTDVRDYEAVLPYEQDVYPYDHTGNSEGSGQMAENIFVEEYTFLETVHVLAGFLDTFALLYPRIQDVDLRTQAASLAVPVYLAQGAHEAPGRARPAREWFDRLQAPGKELVVFDSSGHRPLWEQPDEFLEFMTGTVLAQTSTGTTR